MTVKELKEKVAALPETLDDATVYSYSDIDEGADFAGTVTVYNQESHDSNQGTPYCKGDAPWDNHPNVWKGSPSFVIIG